MIPELTLILWIAAFALAFSLVLTPLTRDAFVQLGLVDRPDGGRKFHSRAVPRAGGIPIVVSYVAAFALLLSLPGASGTPLEGQLPFVLRLLPAATIIFLTGLLDDIVSLRPWQKLAGQVAGAGWAVAGGVQIHGLGGVALGEPLGAAVTVAWLIGCTNAFNLIDGLDGLASGMGLFSTLTMFVAALLHGDNALALATLPLCGSLLGFLRYNFNPASVFLGDSGSLLIGFLLGCYGVIWSHKSVTLLGMTAPLMALAIPLLDVSLSIVRRWIRGQPIFGADRSHIHHKLLDKGLTHRRVVIVLYAVCGVYAALSLLQSVAQNRLGGLILVIFCAVTWAGIQNLGYLEFQFARRAVFGGAIRRIVRGEMVLDGLERSIAGASSARACFEAIQGPLKDAGFTTIHARLNGQEFRHHRAGADMPCWQLRIPLPGGDWVNMEQQVDIPVHSLVVGPLVELLHRHLPRQLAAVRPAERASEAMSLAMLAAEVSSYEPDPRAAVGTINE